MTTKEAPAAPKSLREAIGIIEGWTNCHFMQGCPHDEELEPVVEFLKALESSSTPESRVLAALETKVKELQVFGAPKRWHTDLKAAYAEGALDIRTAVLAAIAASRKESR